MYLARIQNRLSLTLCWTKSRRPWTTISWEGPSDLARGACLQRRRERGRLPHPSTSVFSQHNCKTSILSYPLCRKKYESWEARRRIAASAVAATGAANLFRQSTQDIYRHRRPSFTVIRSEQVMPFALMTHVLLALSLGPRHRVNGEMHSRHSPPPNVLSPNVSSFDVTE